MQKNKNKSNGMTFLCHRTKLSQLFIRLFTFGLPFSQGFSDYFNFAFDGQTINIFTVFTKTFEISVKMSLNSGAIHDLEMWI